MEQSEIRIGKKVYHKDVYDGGEEMEVVGIRATEVELRGDWSGGTHHTVGDCWMPIDGLLEKKAKRTGIWGQDLDECDALFEKITRNAGPRD